LSTAKTICFEIPNNGPLFDAFQNEKHYSNEWEQLADVGFGSMFVLKQDTE